MLRSFLDYSEIDFDRWVANEHSCNIQQRPSRLTHSTKVHSYADMDIGMWPFPQVINNDVIVRRAN